METNILKAVDVHMLNGVDRHSLDHSHHLNMVERNRHLMDHFKNNQTDRLAHTGCSRVRLEAAADRITAADRIGWEALDRYP